MPSTNHLRKSVMFNPYPSWTELHKKLCSPDTDLASPLANLEAFWGGWWPLSELLEIRAISRAAICSVATGLMVAPGFSVNFGAMDVLLSHIVPLFLSPLFQACLPFSLVSPHPSVHSQIQQLWIASVPSTDWTRCSWQCEQIMFPALKELPVQWVRRTNKQSIVSSVIRDPSGSG